MAFALGKTPLDEPDIPIRKFDAGDVAVGVATAARVEVTRPCFDAVIAGRILACADFDVFSQARRLFHEIRGARGGIQLQKAVQLRDQLLQMRARAPHGAMGVPGDEEQLLMSTGPPVEHRVMPRAETGVGGGSGPSLAGEDLEQPVHIPHEEL